MFNTKTNTHAVDGNIFRSLRKCFCLHHFNCHLWNTFSMTLCASDDAIDFIWVFPLIGIPSKGTWLPQLVYLRINKQTRNKSQSPLNPWTITHWFTVFVIHHFHHETQYSSRRSRKAMSNMRWEMFEAHGSRRDHIHAVYIYENKVID